MTETKTEIGFVSKDYITVIFKTDSLPEARHKLTYDEAKRLVKAINKIIRQGKEHKKVSG